MIPNKFKVGDFVYKHTGEYGGPGIVRAVVVLPGGRLRYLVGHMIADGYGEFLHIYSQGNLRPLGEETK
jgi:hypothetical protein